MGTCLNDSCHKVEWQATFPGILNNLKDKILLASNVTERTDELPKTMTTEAVYMICVLSGFLIFSLVGSSITAFEYFYEMKDMKNETHDMKNAKEVTIAEKKEKGANHSTVINLNSAINWTDMEEFASQSVTLDINAGLLKAKRFFKCFCFLTNARKIVARTTSNEKEITCVHGIRAIHFFWLIFIHTCMLYIGSVKNPEDQGPYLRTWLPKAILRGDYVNDALFSLGGFLNAFSFFQNYEKKRGNISWFNFLIKRIVRVSPLYMIILGFYTTLIPYFGSGPVWPTYSTHPVCKNIWWWNLLFVNDFLAAQNQCMIFTWYLATDFQFYIVSPLFMVSLRRWPKLGYILTVICICGSCLSNFLITKAFNLTKDIYRIGFHISDMQGFLEGMFEIFEKLHEKPYTRVSSYLVGILLGHYLSNTKRSMTTKKNSIFLYCGWILTAISMWISFVILGNPEEPLIKFAVFNGMRHLVFACIISWFIFVCSTGQADFINRWLSCHGFVVLSRISYCTCLLNFIVLEYHFLNLTELGEFSVTYLLIKTAFVFFWTSVASFLVSALIEIPVSRLYSMHSSKRKNV